jgi:hypothetical protein
MERGNNNGTSKMVISKFIIYHGIYGGKITTIRIALKVKRSALFALQTEVYYQASGQYHMYNTASQQLMVNITMCAPPNPVCVMN